jgi:hypothetical protein
MNKHIKPQELPLPRPVESIAAPTGAEGITKEDLPEANAGLAEDFEWDDVHILLNEQPETAMYIGQHDHIVIRQRCRPDDGSSVIIVSENATAFLEGMAAYLCYK